jgi:hypothetical protein
MQGTLWLANAIRLLHISTGHFTFHPCCRTDLSAHRASTSTGFACCWRLLEAEAAGSCAAASVVNRCANDKWERNPTAHEHFFQ